MLSTELWILTLFFSQFHICLPTRRCLIGFTSCLFRTTAIGSGNRSKRMLCFERRGRMLSRVLQHRSCQHSERHRCAEWAQCDQCQLLHANELVGSVALSCLTNFTVFTSFSLIKRMLWPSQTDTAHCHSSPLDDVALLDKRPKNCSFLEIWHSIQSISTELYVQYCIFKWAWEWRLLRGQVNYTVPQQHQHQQKVSCQYWSQCKSVVSSLMVRDRR